jgi:DNA-binding transcriptional LysR family regulator
MTAADDAFQHRLLAPAYVLAVVSRRHRFAKNRKLELTELAKESLLLLRRDYASRGWFEAACNVAHIKPRVVLESAAPHTLLALARTGDDVAIVPSNVAIPARAVHAIPIVHRGVPLGRWTVVAWDPQRFLSPYAEAFIDELVVYCSRHYPGREFVNRVPALPKPAGMRG